MKTTLTAAGCVAAFLLLLAGMDWLVEGNHFLLYRFWAPKQEQVRREVYEQTKSYRKGNADRLSNLCGQLATVGDDQGGVIRDQIAHEFSDVSTSDVPDYLRSCLSASRTN